MIHQLDSHLGANFKLLWIPEIDSKESIPPGYIGWRNSFLGIDSWARLHKRLKIRARFELSFARTFLLFWPKMLVGTQKHVLHTYAAVS